MEGMGWEHFSLSLVVGRKKSGEFGGVGWGGVQRAEEGRRAALEVARVKVRGSLVCTSFSFSSAVRTGKDVLWAQTHPIQPQLWYLLHGCPCEK